VDAGKDVAFSGLTVGPLCCGPDPLCCEGTCGSTGQCLRFRSLWATDRDRWKVEVSVLEDDAPYLVKKISSDPASNGNHSENQKCRRWQVIQKKNHDMDPYRLFWQLHQRQAT